jgi:HEAT repeat protein
MSAQPSSADVQENLSLLGSEHGDYRIAVRWFEQQGPDVVPSLVAALREERTPHLRRSRIVETLGELRDGSAVPALVAVLESGELTWEAAQALGKIGSPGAEQALLRGLGDARLAIVKECTKALGHVRSAAAAAALGRQLLHPDASVRCHAVRALVQARPAGLASTLRSHLPGERDPEVRSLIERHLP